MMRRDIVTGLDASSALIVLKTIGRIVYQFEEYAVQYPLVETSRAYLSFCDPNERCERPRPLS